MSEPYLTDIFTHRIDLGNGDHADAVVPAKLLKTSKKVRGDFGFDVILATDEGGREHRGKGAGGGQFVGKEKKLILPLDEKDLKSAQNMGLPTTYIGTMSTQYGSVRNVVDNPLPMSTVSPLDLEFLTDLDEPILGRTSFRVEQLKAVQDWIRPSVVEKYKNESKTEGSRLPLIAILDDEMIIMDGNHSVVAAVIRGDESIQADYITITDEDKEKLRVYKETTKLSLAKYNISEATMSTDSAGHQHKGKGEGGGQFTKSNSNDGTSDGDSASLPPDLLKAIPQGLSAKPGMMVHIKRMAKIANAKLAPLFHFISEDIIPNAWEHARNALVSTAVPGVPVNDILVGATKIIAWAWHKAKGKKVSAAAALAMDRDHIADMEKLVGILYEMLGVPEDTPMPTREVLAKSLKRGKTDSSKSLAIDDLDGDRNQLIAEILVLLFDEGAEDMAGDIARDEIANAELSIALAPTVTKRYGKRPGPGWVAGSRTRNGVQIWHYGTVPRTTPAPRQTPSAPVIPTPAPPPPIATPVVSPVPQPVGRYVVSHQQRLARATTAYQSAMATLGTGSQLTAQQKQDLSRGLSSLSTTQLRALHTAVGGTGAIVGTQRQPWVHAIKAILAGVPTPASSPVPIPVAQPVAPPIVSAPPPPVAAQPATPSASLLSLLPVPLQSVAAQIRALAIAALDRTITRLEAIQGMGNLMTGLSSRAVGDMAIVFNTGAGVTSSADDYLRAVAISDPGHVGPSPPGPPPRPGLVWNPTTHRWILAPVAAPSPPVAAPLPIPLPTPTPAIASGVKLSTKEENWKTGDAKHGTSLNGIDFKPAPPKFWEKVKDVDINEPPPVHGKKIDRCSIMVQEPDGRVWIVQPTNHFGDRKYTMPGGSVEPGLTDQQNALKEFWEETGLQVEITGHLGDFEDSNNKNNGRLYIGKRVGGAPWDAKIESKIIDQKTGKPAAESDSVHLVPPDVAAKLLHRTDDLAQIAMVNPISINTKPDGAVIDKIVRGVQSRAKQYEDKKTAANEAPGDTTLHVIQEARGFNGKPTVVKESEFDDLMKRGGHIELLRGIAKTPPSSAHARSVLTPSEMAKQFKTGEHFPGHGMYGVGTYADATKGYSNVASGTYAGGGVVMRLALPKTAKIVKFSDLKKNTLSHPKHYQVPPYKDKTDYWRGVHAALAGYDAIEVDNSYNGNKYYVILNRSILTVQSNNSPGGYKIS